LKSYPLDQRHAGQADHEVRGEKAELDQYRLRVAEREQLVELGDDHIVETGDAPEHEEQRHHEQTQARRVGVAIPRHCGLVVG